MKIRRWHILSKIIATYNIQSVVEIGILRAENASNILCDHPKLKYVGVDPYCETPTNLSEYEHERNKPLAQKVFDKYENAKLVVGFSKDCPQDETFDLVFIDGDHSYQAVKDDIEFWKKRIRIGGIISGHDYRKPDVKRAVHETLGSEIHLEPDNVWWVSNN